MTIYREQFPGGLTILGSVHVSSHAPAADSGESIRAAPAAVISSAHDRPADTLFIDNDDSVHAVGIADASLKHHAGKRILSKLADYIFCNKKEIFQGGISSGILSELTADCIRELSRTCRLHDDALASSLLMLSFSEETGRYYAIHLGDGCILGIRKDSNIIIISPPGNGTLPPLTWQTGEYAEHFQSHLEIQTGDIYQYHRIMLLNNKADSICNGKDIAPKMQQFISTKKDTEILDYLDSDRTAEGAAGLIIDISADSRRCRIPQEGHSVIQ